LFVKFLLAPTVPGGSASLDAPASGIEACLKIVWRGDAPGSVPTGDGGNEEKKKSQSVGESLYEAEISPIDQQARIAIVKINIG
jgi:hypothetical protein